MEKKNKKNGEGRKKNFWREGKECWREVERMLKGKWHLGAIVFIS